MELYNNMRGGPKSEPALMKTPASWKKYAKSCSAVGAQVLIVREEFMQGMEQRPNDVVVKDARDFDDI